MNENPSRKSTEGLDNPMPVETVPKPAGKTFRRKRRTATFTLPRWQFFGLLAVVFALGIGAGYLLWGRGKPSQEEQSVKRYDVPVDDDPAIGPEDAPITIIEFSDYQCPYCRRWYLDAFKKLRQNYPDKVRIVFRDFPLYSVHPEAGPAAEAANCAGEQGDYWSFHNMLFEGGQYGKDVYLRYADQLRLDIEKFKACLDSGRYASEVQADFRYASDLGVSSVPTFFVNGIPIVGAQSYEVFVDVIEKELAGKIPK